MKKPVSRYCAIILTLAFIMTSMTFVPVCAADESALSVNSSVKGSISSGQMIWYTLVVPADGAINFSLSVSKQYFYVDMQLCNTEMYQRNIKDGTRDHWVVKNFAIGLASAAQMSFDHLKAGRYYVLLRGWPSDFPGVVDTSDYSIACTLTPAPLDSDIEPNDTVETAQKINTDYIGSGHIDYEEGFGIKTDKTDWYKVTTASKGTLTLKFKTVPAQYGDIYTLKVFKAGITDDTKYLSLDYTGGANTTIRKLENLAAGTYYIKLTGWSSYFSSYNLAVSFAGPPVPATAVTLPESAATYVGAKLTLKPTLSPANSTEKTFLWSSSNSKVAAVDANGNISALAVGTAVITVKTASGKGDACKLTVKPTVSATPANSTVLVNGVLTSFCAYKIDGSNYFKLRDLAFVLAETSKHFDVGWDGVNKAISLTSGSAYTPAGGEMAPAADKLPKQASAATAKIYIDGKPVSFTAFLIDGNNYFKLRDIAGAFDIGVTWDDTTNTIGIDTTIGYAAP